MEKDALINTLKDGDSWESRRDAAEQLSAFKDKEVIDNLILAMQNDDHWVVRHMSAHSLGEIGSIEAVDALINALNDREHSVVETAATALGKIRDDRAIEPLLSTLGYEKDFAPTQTAALALAEFGTKVVQPIIECLEDPKKRLAAMIALGIIKDKRALPPLVKILNDVSSGVGYKMEAAAALGNLRDPKAKEPLRAALSVATDPRLVRVINDALKKLEVAPESDTSKKWWQFWK
jgi:HEAT repeat protein